MSKLNDLKNDNPRYWALCVGRSQYSEQEILEALKDAERANSEWRAFLVKAYEVLTFEDGVGMNPVTGFASGDHRQLSTLLAEANGYVYPGMSENSHRNCFPVKKWQADVKRTRRDMIKIQKFIERIKK